MKIIFVFAHPDDESFSSAGTIAKLTRSGATVKLITFTRGEMGQLGDPPITTQDNLGKVREQELRNAGKVLGISEIIFLDYIDATLATIEKGPPMHSIFSFLQKEQPDIVVTFDEQGGSNHSDHIATSIIATDAYIMYQKIAKKHVRLYHVVVPQSNLKKYEGTDMEYTAFGKIIGTPDSEITTVVDVSDTYETKLQAFKCHVSQKKDWERIIKRGKVVNLAKEYFTLISENSL